MTHGISVVISKPLVDTLSIKHILARTWHIDKVAPFSTKVTQQNLLRFKGTIFALGQIQEMTAQMNENIIWSTFTGRFTKIKLQNPPWDFHGWKKTCSVTCTADSLNLKLQSNTTLKVIWSVGIKGSEIFRDNSHLFDFYLKAYYVHVCIVTWKLFTWKLFTWNLLNSICRIWS